MNEHKLKEQICEIGRRLYAKGFAAANDGNITIRLNEREVLCTPTMVSKGFLKPEDICKVDYEGKQLAGIEEAHQRGAAAPGRLQAPARRDGLRPLPSAARHRLRRRPGADPQVRAARGRGLPRRGAHRRVRDARRTRSSPTRVAALRPSDCNTIILANHGTVTFGPDLEKAYFNTEIIDAYCKILILARQLGRVNYFSEAADPGTDGLQKEIGLRRRPFQEPRLRPLRPQHVQRAARRLRAGAARLRPGRRRPAVVPHRERPQRRSPTRTTWCV